MQGLDLTWRADPLQGAFRALGDPSRRKILDHLSRRDMTITEVAELFDMTRAAVKKHLRVLEEGRLISVHPRGRERVNCLEPLTLQTVEHWIIAYNDLWDDKLVQLKAAVEAAERNRMPATTLTKTVILAASPETVWSFLTDKSLLATWFYPANADLAEGRDYELIGSSGPAPTRICWGQVERMDAPRQLTYSFTTVQMGGVVTSVSWLLEEVPGGTRLTLTHAGFDQMGADTLGMLMAFDTGWDRHLAGLRGATGG